MVLSTLPTWVTHWSTRFPDRPAIHFEGRQITWREFDDEVSRWRVRLERAGVSSGDRVALLLLNRPEFLMAEWACHQVGAIVMPINTRLAVPEFQTILDDARPAVVVYESVPQLAPLARFLREEWTAGTALDVDDVEPVVDLVDSPRLERDTSEPAVIMYTSGTTGLPKGVTITLGNLEASRVLWMTEFALTHHDVHLVCMPLCFAGGFIASSKHAIAAGGTMVLMRDFKSDTALELIERHSVSWITAVPVMLQRMRDSSRWDATDLSSLNGMQSGGAVVPPELVAAFGRRGVSLSQAYGLSEGTAGPSMYVDEEFIASKPGSVGRAALGFEVKLVDAAGNEVPTGQTGEIALKGPQVFDGYWNRPDLTEQAMRDGWLLTGDLARCDADGFYFIEGRSKEMIVSGGLNVYPAEVELVVNEFDGVAESVVIGMPSERWGEEVVACVIPEAGAVISPEDLIAFARRRLADYKVPKSIILVDEFPRTLSSKVQRVILRDRLVNGPKAGPA